MSYFIICFPKAFDCISSHSFITERWAEKFQGVVHVDFRPPGKQFCGLFDFSWICPTDTFQKFG